MTQDERTTLWENISYPEMHSDDLVIWKSKPQFISNTNALFPRVPPHVASPPSFRFSHEATQEIPMPGK